MGENLLDSIEPGLVLETPGLVLEDGSLFSGSRFGAVKSVAGEVVFNTGMTGYPESLTDPSYRGQILVLTYPLIGNYGVPKPQRDTHGILENFESERIQVTGLIVADYSAEYSHWSAVRSLGDWLQEQGVPGIFGVDTRALTKQLREKGVMLGKMLVDDTVDTIRFEDPNERNLVSEVSTAKPVTYGSGRHKIVLVDCGMKNAILRSLLRFDTTVRVVPWDYDFTDEGFDGLFISNGPGDPKQCTEMIEHVRQAMENKKPVFGICLGNQILALAAGADTYKLKYGHRSQNQPCIDTLTKRCYITSQNHGYAVNTETLREGWKEWFINANDHTNEGILHESGLFFGVQFHPEATPGPEDTPFLFNRFIKVVDNAKG